MKVSCNHGRQVYTEFTPKDIEMYRWLVVTATESLDAITFLDNVKSKVREYTISKFGRVDDWQGDQKANIWEIKNNLYLILSIIHKQTQGKLEGLLVVEE